MIDYWQMKENGRVKKIKNGERIMEALKKFVGTV